MTSKKLVSWRVWDRRKPYSLFSNCGVIKTVTLREAKQLYAARIKSPYGAVKGERWDKE